MEVIDLKEVYTNLDNYSYKKLGNIYNILKEIKETVIESYRLQLLDELSLMDKLGIIINKEYLWMVIKVEAIKKEKRENEKYIKNLITEIKEKRNEI